MAGKTIEELLELPAVTDALMIPVDNGEVTFRGTVAQLKAHILATNGIPNTLLAQMPTLTIKGNDTGGTANAKDLTVAEVTAMLAVFTDLLKGLVPASGGGTSNFLRADGIWAAPAAGAGPRDQVILDTDAGAGSTNTRNRNFTNITTTGTALTGANSATNGASVTVNEAGVYSITWSGPRFTVAQTLEITRNTVGFIGSGPDANMLAFFDHPSTALHGIATVTRILAVNDVIRVSTFGASPTATNSEFQSFSVTKVAN